MPDDSEFAKSRTFENLRSAFAEEAALAYRCLYFSILADFEGLDRHSALFKEIAEGGESFVQGCFDFLSLARDPDSGLEVGGTLKNLEALLQIKARQHGRTYPEMAKAARAEGFPDIASWFDTLEKAKRAHAQKLRKLSGG